MSRGYPTSLTNRGVGGSKFAKMSSRRGQIPVVTMAKGGSWTLRNRKRLLLLRMSVWVTKPRRV